MTEIPTNTGSSAPTPSQSVESEPPRRQLPIGHDDEASPYFVAPDYRAAFLCVDDPSPAELERSIGRHKQRLHAEFLNRRWERARDHAARHGEERLRRFLKEHTTGDGARRLLWVRDPDGPASTPQASDMTLDHADLQLATFEAVRDKAVRTVDDPKRAQAAAARYRLAFTCQVCHELDDDVSPLKAPDGRDRGRVCPRCREAVALVDSLTAPVAAAATRLEAVLAWSAAAASEVDLLAALDAYIDGPDEREPNSLEPSASVDEPAAPTFLRRLLGRG